MAQGKMEEDAKTKPALSSRLMQMKFMQRGKEKAVLQEAVAEQVKTEDESKWVADGAQRGCVVLCEGDPPPGAHMGHMSFSSFNPALQKLQDEREAALTAARKIASLGADGKVIPDSDMAEQLTNLQCNEDDVDHIEKKRPGRRIKSLREGMREGRSKPHQAELDNTSKSVRKRKRKRNHQ